MTDRDEIDEIDILRQAQFGWGWINRRLQGEKPNQWIPLSKAVERVRKKLNVLVGMAQEILQKEAIPPAVPWAGTWLLPVQCFSEAWTAGVFAKTLNLPLDKTTAYLERMVERMGRVDGTVPVIMQISPAELRVTEVDFSLAMMVFPRRAGRIEDIRIEQNHLMAWLEKYKAQRPQLASRRADSDAEAPDPSHNGFPGRPSIKHLILAELKRRAEAGETLPAVGKEAQALHEWAAEHHPQAQTPGIGAIENFIRDSHRRLRSTK